jgi:paraquat-inducible protein A
LLRPRLDPLNTSLALIISAIALGIPALLEPLFVVNVYGRVRSNAVFTGVNSLCTDTLWPLALMVLGYVMILPAVWLGALLVVFICLWRRRRPPWLPRSFWIAEALNEWAMPDVFMVGALVAYTRLRALATTDVAMGGWCFLAFALVIMALRRALEPEQIWEAIGGKDPGASAPVNAITCPVCALVLAS